MSPATTMPFASRLNSSNEQSSRLPALQPLDLSSANDSSAPSSRSEKLGRRESRYGLRSIFGRSKPAKNLDEPTSPRLAKPNGLDNATEGIPYYTLPPGKPIVRSDVARPLSTTQEEAETIKEAATVPDIPKRSQTRSSKGNSAKAAAPSWDSPPLHKAYTQAIRYSTLPATTVPADLILRAQEKKAGEAAEDTSKKSHRRARSNTGLNLQWTTKTYILVTSGYLLEYASEGPFDRLPEKVLRLNQSSAAFASDMIPGKHWVLQVVSATETSEVRASGEPSNKSFFSKLPFRGGPEKRTASNMLLVFDNADTMDEWLATLRRGIESLGGKKNLSETGTPKGDHAVPLREQTSQRTLVVRDSDRHRYSRSIPDSHSWEPDFVRRDSDASFIVSETGRDQSIDDMSATNSVISHDGQQLESLRNSANRLSCISSGQRTFITSAASSPSCSPTVETFSTPPEEAPRRHPDATRPDSTLRPNAGAIAERRKSMLTMGAFTESGSNQVPPRPYSTLVNSSMAPALDSEPPARTTLSPNFSVPNTSNRRYSTLRMPTVEASPPSSPQKEAEPPARTMSRKPPTSLRISRPLSMVEDQPSPREPVPERPATRHGEAPKPAEPELVPLPPSRPESRVQDSRSSTPSLGVQSPPKRMSIQNSPRRLSSMGALRQHGDPSFGGAPIRQEPPKMRALHPSHPRFQDPERSHSSIDPYERSKGLTPPPRMNKRSSMLPFVPGVSSSAMHAPPLAPPPSIPLPPVPQSSNNRLKPDSNSHALLNRRSMPHLVEGPPPAPPPTCALPPIPTKASKRNMI